MQGTTALRSARHRSAKLAVSPVNRAARPCRRA
jgi:hypothetical protein